MFSFRSNYSVPRLSRKMIGLVKRILLVYLRCGDLREGRWDGVVDIATVVRAGRFEVRIPIGVRGLSLFRNVQTGSGAYPALYSMGTGILYRGLTFATRLYLVPMLIMSGVIPLLPRAG
jgi:hypothetical protein